MAMAMGPSHGVPRVRLGTLRILEFRAPLSLARETIGLRSSRVATGLLAEEPIDTDNS
jgi:hypothetical protein